MGHKDEPISRMSMPNRGAQVNTPQFMGWQEGLDMAQVQKIIKRQNPMMIPTSVCACT